MLGNSDTYSPIGKPGTSRFPLPQRNLSIHEFKEELSVLDISILSICCTRQSQFLQTNSLPRILPTPVLK
jgi:hypothetical protein